jgi:succinate dehydrogenase / fumarate reductase membrane anchor subunit
VRGGFSGLRAWVIQRLSAIYLALFTLVAAAAFLLAPPQSYEAWRATVAQPWIQLASALFILALVAHAWIGLRDVVMDYVKPVGLRLLVLFAIVLVLGASALWALRALILVTVQ